MSQETHPTLGAKIRTYESVFCGCRGMLLTGVCLVSLLVGILMVLGLTAHKMGRVELFPGSLKTDMDLVTCGVINLIPLFVGVYGIYMAVRRPQFVLYRNGLLYQSWPDDDVPIHWGDIADFRVRILKRGRFIRGVVGNLRLKDGSRYRINGDIVYPLDLIEEIDRLTGY